MVQLLLRLSQHKRCVEQLTL